MAGGDELRDIEEQIGVDLDTAVEGILDEVDDDDDDDDGVGAMLDGDEDGIAALIKRKIPLLKKADAEAEIRDVARVLAARVSAVERLLSTAATVKKVADGIRPNSAETLYAAGEGVPVVPGATYHLRPRLGGALLGDNFVFKKTMTFCRAICEPIDCGEGFYIVGGSLGWQDDKARPIDHDCNISIFRPERDVKETPLASLHGRSPQEKTDFTAAIRLDKPAGAGNERIFHGLTVEIFDTECTKRVLTSWGTTAGEMSFPTMTRSLQERVARMLRRRPARRKVRRPR